MDEAGPLIEQEVVVETVHDEEGSGQEKSEDIVLFCEDLTKKEGKVVVLYSLYSCAIYMERSYNKHHWIITLFCVFKRYIPQKMFELMTTITNVYAKLNAVGYKHASVHEAEAEALVVSHMANVLGTKCKPWAAQGYLVPRLVQLCRKQLWQAF